MEIPAPQKITTRSSSSACTRRSGTIGPSWMNLGTSCAPPGLRPSTDGWRPPASRAWHTRRRPQQPYAQEPLSLNRPAHGRREGDRTSALRRDPNVAFWRNGGIAVVEPLVQADQLASGQERAWVLLRPPLRPVFGVEFGTVLLSEVGNCVSRRRLACPSSGVAVRSRKSIFLDGQARLLPHRFRTSELSSADRRSGRLPERRVFSRHLLADR
jgi:hypothetical protein